MSEVILGAKRQVWIRTKDGVVHLALESRHGGIRWGYKGGSPTTFALLIEQLLDGTSLRAVTDHKKPNKNLAKIAYHRWPVGTVFTREQLIAARNGTFTPPETA